MLQKLYLLLSDPFDIWIVAALYLDYIGLFSGNVENMARIMKCDKETKTVHLSQKKTKDVMSVPYAKIGRRKFRF